MILYEVLVVGVIDLAQTTSCTGRVVLIVLHASQHHLSCQRMCLCVGSMLSDMRNSWWCHTGAWWLYRVRGREGGREGGIKEIDTYSLILRGKQCQPSHLRFSILGAN